MTAVTAPVVPAKLEGQNTGREQTRPVRAPD